MRVVGHKFVITSAGNQNRASSISSRYSTVVDMTTPSTVMKGPFRKLLWWLDKGPDSRPCLRGLKHYVATTLPWMLSQEYVNPNSLVYYTSSEAVHVCLMKLLDFSFSIPFLLRKIKLLGRKPLDAYHQSRTQNSSLGWADLLTTLGGLGVWNTPQDSGRSGGKSWNFKRV